MVPFDTYFCVRVEYAERKCEVGFEAGRRENESDRETNKCGQKFLLNLELSKFLCTLGSKELYSAFLPTAPAVTVHCRVVQWW